MAIRTLILRKKISEKSKELEALRSLTADFESRKADLEKREAELEKAIEEASTEEERSVVEDEADKFEADQSALETDISENDEKITNLEGEISEMERELSEIEENQRAVPAAPAPELTDEPETRKTERKFHTMLKTRSLRQMSIQERDAFVQADETQALVAEIRSAIKEKRAISGGAYTISDTIIGLLREDVMDYSKLYKHVNVIRLTGKGREIVMGTTPEAIWEECCDPLYELNQAFTQVELDCYKLAGYFAVCNALLEDSDIDLLDALMSSLNASMGYALDKAILYGKGSTGKMPTGVVTALAADQTLSDHIITIPAASSTGVKLFQSLILGASKAANRYARGEKVWAMSEATYATVVSESIAVNAAGAIVSGVNGTMPVTGGIIEVLNFIPASNIVAGYFELYVLGERKGMTIDTSEHVKFIEDQTVIRGRCRYDGKPAIPAAFIAVGLNATAPTTSIDFATPPEEEGGEG
jgi:HK97 family phage major capsid protein